MPRIVQSIPDHETNLIGCPVHRRGFLVAAGMLVLRPHSLWSAERERTPLSFVVVSDTHLGYRDKTHASEQWEKIAAEVAQAKGDLVLHLGDVVDGGRESQYPIYLETRKTIGKPVHEIPGNHDPHELFEKYLRKPIDTVVDHEWLKFLLVNNARTDSHDGFLSKEQLRWIDAECASAAKDDRHVVICMHVPAHKNLHPDRGWYIKPDQGQIELYALLERHRDRVLMLMHGHFHNGLRGWNDHPVHEVCFPSALYNLDRKLEAQNAPGYNPLEFRPGYTLIEIKEGELKLSYKPLSEESSVEKKLPWPDRAS